jgi:hypothetical protein
MKRISNRYVVTFNSVDYPTLSLAAVASGVKRPTLTKAVIRKYAKQEVSNDNLIITVQGATFKLKRFTVNR